MGRRRGRGDPLSSVWLTGFVVAVFVAGFAGIGVGYKIEQNRTQPTVKTATATAAFKKNRANGLTAVQNNMRTCLVGAGLRWPTIPGKFMTQVRTPPPGVSEAQRINALIICYIATVAGKRAAP